MVARRYEGAALRCPRQNLPIEGRRQRRPLHQFAVPLLRARVALVGDLRQAVIVRLRARLVPARGTALAVALRYLLGRRRAAGNQRRQRQQQEGPAGSLVISEARSVAWNEWPAIALIFRRPCA